MFGVDEKSCSNLNLYTFLGDEIETFRQSSEHKRSFHKYISAGTDSVYLNVVIKAISDDRETLLIELSDVTAAENLKNSVNMLTEGIMSEVGDRFFASLVTHLVKATGADHAIICEFTDDTHTTARTVSAVADGQLTDDFEFNLENTPCKFVVEKGLQEFHSGVSELFSKSDMVLALGVDSYYGIPLTDSKGNILGPMAIMSRKPLRNSELAVSMLKLFSVRASAELERRQNEKSLQNNVHFMRTMMEAFPNPIFYKDIDGRYIGCNTALEEYIGLEKEYIIGKPLGFLTDSDWKTQCERTDRQLIADGRIRPYESKIDMPDGSIRNVIVTKALFTDSQDRKQAIVGTFIDITERKAAEQQIKRLAYYDTLTNLPNRALLLDRINIQIKYAQRHKENFAVLFLDLDRFKYINDTLGHSAGDQLLNNVANLLINNVRSCDTVARLGGDEFVIVVSNVHERDVSHLAVKLLNIISKNQFVNGHEVFTSLSIGISMFPYDGEDPETLLKNADLAMYQAKEHGRNGYEFFATEMNRKVQERLSLENDMRRAIDKSEFFLLYQPQISAKTGEMFGAEALIRWKQPQKGLIMPSEFISVAEETGLILQIGEWVLLRACFQNVEWNKKYNASLTTSVNISAVQFKHKNFLTTVRNIIQFTGVNPALIDLELTESVLMTNIAETLETLDALKDFGFKLSIDDFGTGYSSLNYLRHFPIDRLKIDKSFVKDIKADKDNTSITKAIIAMADSLHLSVTAEGVETEDQLKTLIDLNCYDIQGFYYARPLPAETIESMLKNKSAAHGGA